VTSNRQQEDEFITTFLMKNNRKLFTKKGDFIIFSSNPPFSKCIPFPSYILSTRYVFVTGLLIKPTQHATKPNTNRLATKHFGPKTYLVLCSN